MGGGGNKPLCLLRKKEEGATIDKEQIREIDNIYLLQKTFFGKPRGDSVTKRGDVDREREALQFSGGTKENRIRDKRKINPRVGPFLSDIL
jgi:hypothetical protein